MDRHGVVNALPERLSVVGHEHGWLIGHDAGEWGGGLLDVDTTGCASVLLRAGVAYVFEDASSYHALLPYRDGALDRSILVTLHRGADGWTLEDPASCPAIP